MTYAEFAARPASVNDAECATVVMGWILQEVWLEPSSDGEAWRAIGKCPAFTTDRNATAMLVEEVAKRGRNAVLLFISFFGDATGGRRIGPEGAVSVTWTPVDVLCAAPSLVAWACCEACRGAS